MSDSPRHRPTMSGALMFIGVVLQQRAANHVSGKDFLFLVVGGAAFGAGLVDLVRFLVARPWRR
jgi:hypothetical protein